MSLINIFQNDAFTAVSLTAAINKIPHKPTRIGTLGWFRASGIPTDTAVIEEKNGTIELVQTSERGGPAPTRGNQKRTVRSFLIPHLKKESTIQASSIQGVRAFGSENSLEAVQAVVNERLTDLANDLDVTIERHRVGAIKGQVLDADDSVLFNFFTEFGVSQQTHEFDLNNDAIFLRKECVEIQRMSENELGAETVTSYRAFCGDSFFDQLIEHESIREALRNQEGRLLLEDLRKGFTFGGITWENYRGSVNGTPFFDTGEAYVVPEGTGIFKTVYGPGDFMDTVNTIGLPRYARQAVDPEFQRWVKVHAQSNPLNICLRPRAIVKVTIGS